MRSSRMSLTTVVVLGAACVFLLSACAPGANDLLGVAGAQGVVAGFWRGLWHGFIAPVTFIVSLFSSDVTLYEVHNNGAWYNLGFLLGINAVLGGHAARGSWPKKKVVKA